MCIQVITNNFIPIITDGQMGNTGPGDPWSGGGGGGVQPPYSGYAPPHLAQPATYPSIHIPHDPMVKIISLHHITY